MHTHMLSAHAHTLACKSSQKHEHTNSRSLNDALLLLDYVGISVLIAGSYYPPIFYGFYCDSTMRFTYTSTVTMLAVFASAVGVYSGLNPSK